jgi:hypothetical protein
VAFWKEKNQEKRSPSLPTSSSRKAKRKQKVRRSTNSRIGGGRAKTSTPGGRAGKTGQEALRKGKEQRKKDPEAEAMYRSRGGKHEEGVVKSNGDFQNSQPRKKRNEKRKDRPMLPISSRENKRVFRITECKKRQKVHPSTEEGGEKKT